MKILKIPTPPVRPTITSAVQFDPWPFKEDSVAMKDTFIISDDGSISPRNQGWCLTRGDFNVLVVLSDNTQAVATPVGLKKYK